MKKEKSDNSLPIGSFLQLSEGISSRQQRAIIALLSKPTIKEAAKEAGVGETTLFNWLNEQIFSACYKAARDKMLETALISLQGASTTAVKTLRDVMEDKTISPSVRVTAARTVLELTLRVKTDLELEARIAQIEEMIAAHFQE